MKRAAITVGTIVFLCLVPATYGVAADSTDPPDRLFVVLSPSDAPGPSHVQAFDIRDSGLPVAAETYPTGGLGDRWASHQDVAVTPDRSFVYAVNNASGTIAGFRVEPDGTLATVPGSPFDAGVRPAFLAAHPTRPYLYATTTDEVRAFRILYDGRLYPLAAVPEPYGRDLVVTPDGHYLYVAVMFGTDRGVRAFELSSSGFPDELRGSPFVYDGGRPSAVAISSDGSYLNVLDLDYGIATFSIDASGGLTHIGQWWAGEFTTRLERTHDDRHLYVGEPSEPLIRGLANDADALPVELPGSPYAAEYDVAELIAPPHLSRLYSVTRAPRTILVLNVTEGGDLIPATAPVLVPGPSDQVPNGAAYLVRQRQEVAIDIRPGSERNPINPRSHGLIPVAILGAERFHVTGVEWASVRFGPAKAIPAHPRPHGLEDVNGDGWLDAVLHFRARATGIACGDETATLTGRTIVDVQNFAGTDTVHVHPCGTTRRGKNTNRTNRDVYPTGVSGTGMPLVE